jgi:hypothetical protein
LTYALALWQKTKFVDEAVVLERLQKVYHSAGITVRFYPQSLTAWRWQAGLNGDDEHFQLLAWSATADGLVDAISTWAKEQARNGH